MTLGSEKGNCRAMWNEYREGRSLCHSFTTMRVPPCHDGVVGGAWGELKGACREGAIVIDVSGDEKLGRGQRPKYNVKTVDQLTAKSRISASVC